MAESPDPPGERATTALVYRTVDDMGRRMDAHFDGVKQRLDRLEPVEGRVDGHDRILTDHEARISAGEQERATLRELARQTQRERSTWRKVTLPALIISGVAVVATVITSIFT